MFVRNLDWPEPCIEKIGLRMEIMTIPIWEYEEISKDQIIDLKNDTNLIPDKCLQFLPS